MSPPHVHATHPALVARLKRAEGHLRHVIGMIEGLIYLVKSEDDFYRDYMAGKRRWF